MERDDLRRADVLNHFWDNMALGRAPGNSRTVDDETADLLGRLQALGDPPELDSARERVWRDLQQHERWKEPDVDSSSFPLNLHAVTPPAASLPGWSLPRPISLPAGGRQFTPPWVLAQAATVLLLIGSLVAALFVLRPDDRPAIVPLAGTPVPAEVDDWPAFKGNAARDGRADAGPVGDPVERWRFQAGGPINPPPAVVAGVAYAGAGDGFLYAIDVATGEELWRFDAGNPVGGSPTVADGVVYVTDGAGVLHAIDAGAGEQRWRSASTVATASAPAVVGDLLYIGTGSLGIEGGDLLAIDVATGEERWRFAVADGGEVRTPAVANGIVYVGSEAGGFVAIDALSGDERWRADTGDDSTGTAVVAEGIAYIGGSGDGGAGHLYAFDAQSGEELWRLDEALYTPAVLDGVAYSASFAGTFAALDTATGAELWRIELPGPLRPPAVASGIIYVPSDTDRAIYALDAATGDEIWRFGVDGAIDGSLAVADGVVYVGTGLGSVYAIGGSDTTTLAAPSADAATPVAASASPSSEMEAAAATGGAASPVEFLWESSGGDQPFDQPGTMAIAPDGRLWVTDGKHSAFQIFAPDGSYVETWGTPGDGEGELNFVRDNGDGIGDIAFVPDGSFYVADSQNRRVQRFDAERQFVTAWGEFGTGDGQFLDPAGVFVDGEGNVLVVDDKRDDVQKFDSEGNFLLKYSGHGSEEGQLNFASWGSLDADGNLWIADFGNHRVQAFTPDGTFHGGFGTPGSGDGQFNGPVDLAVAGDGTIYVTDLENHRVQIFATNGDVLGAWGSEGTELGQFLLPSGVELDGAGNIYVTDVVGNRLQKFRLLPLTTPAVAPEADPASGEMASPTEVLWTAEGGDGGLAIPGNLALDPEGQLWVADNGNDRFQIFDAEGQFIETWGEPGTGDGQFRLRRSNGDGYGGIAFAPDGTFYVLDPGNARIQKFDQDRQFVTSWGGFGEEPGQFLDPVGLAVDAAGTVWVVDDVRNDVQHFDANGMVLGAFVARPDGDSRMNAINGLAIDDAGSLYLSDVPGFQVLAFGADGTPRGVYGGQGDGDGQFTDQPLAMAVDADGRLFVSEGSHIHAFAADGQFIATWTAGEFPYGIALDGAGHLYVADYEANTVQKLRLPPSLQPEAIATPTA